MSKIGDFENKMIINGMSDRDFEEYKLMLQRVHDKWNKYQHCIHAARRFAPKYYQRAIFLIEYAVDNFADKDHYSLVCDPYEAMGDIYFCAKKYDKSYNSYLRAIDECDDNIQSKISSVSEMLLWAKLHLDDFQYSEEMEKYYNDFIKGSNFHLAFLNSRFRRYIAELVIHLHNKNTEYAKIAYKNVCTVLAPDYKGELYDILRKHKYTESIETTDEVISFLKKLTNLFLIRGIIMSMCYGNSLVGTSGVNGDSFYISPDNTVFMLSDGASGAGTEGKVVMSQLCAETVKNNPFSSSELSAKDYLDKIIWQINNKLIEVSQSRKSLVFGTLVICVVCGNTATIAAAGDSPAYVLHNNTAVRIAKPKKTYQNLIDLGFFSEEQLEEAVHRLPEHMWSMFDSFIPTVVPSYSVEEIKLSEGDIIVLCCDGVSDNISPEFIGENIDTHDLTESVDTILNSASERSVKEKGYSDDLTMVVYCY